MKIGGLVKFSLIDYPGKVSAVVFTQGCNFRCSYCHNSELIAPENDENALDEEEVFEFLKKRSDKLQGVVVTGGEPTQQPGLIAFLDRLKRMGYLVKLDTNGSHPKILHQLINLKLINYIAMDIKAPLNKYEEVVGVTYPVEQIKESIDIILRSKMPYQFRTTMVKPLCTDDDISEIIGLIDGTAQYTIQQFKSSEKILDKQLLDNEQYSESEINALKEKLQQRFHGVINK